MREETRSPLNSEEHGCHSWHCDLEAMEHVMYCYVVVVVAVVGEMGGIEGENAKREPCVVKAS